MTSHNSPYGIVPDSMRKEPLGSKSVPMTIQIDPENLNGLLRPVLAEINSMNKAIKEIQVLLDKHCSTIGLLMAEHDTRADDGK